MESTYFSKDMNSAYGLKLKEFKLKLMEADNPKDKSHYIAWISGVFSERGARVGWSVSFNHELDDSLCHLLTDRGVERMFKTVDSAISFFSELGVVTGVNVTWERQ